MILSEILFDSERIQHRVGELGKEISRDYSGKDLVVVGILKGAVIFLSDLVRRIDGTVGVALDFMAVSSYGDSTNTSGIVRILKDLDSSIRGKHVLIVEDIVDTGLTLSYLVKMMHEREPESVHVCALLDKKERRKIEVAVRYTGYVIPDYIVVGYGLDYSGRWRNVPSIHVVVPERGENA